MPLLTELENPLRWVLQRCRAYGAVANPSSNKRSSIGVATTSIPEICCASSASAPRTDSSVRLGYAFVNGYKPTIAKYLVSELKKDTANAEDVEQLMKYVDWVKDEYAFGDYSMIRAFLIAHDFTSDAKELLSKLASRRFIVGRRPALSQEWTDLALVKYAYNPSSKRLDFSFA